MSDRGVKSAGAMVQGAKSRIQNLDPDQVAKELESGEALLVDVRDAPEREEHGAIPGALHIPRGMLEFRADAGTPYHNSELRPDRRIILACASGGRSALATDLLQEMGYKNVANLAGGFKAWQESGLPVDKV
ncbi:MAG: rhodanese-like domain-containing protein [Trueperaceae bacterium]